MPPAMPHVHGRTRDFGIGNKIKISPDLAGSPYTSKLKARCTLQSADCQLGKRTELGLKLAPVQSLLREQLTDCQTLLGSSDWAARCGE